MYNGSRFLRRSLPFLFALLLAGNAQAEWFLLGRTDTFRIYLEKGSTQRSETTVQAVQLLDFVKAQWIDAQTVIMSVKSVVEFDCTQPRVRNISVETYSEQMTGGRLVSSEKFPAPAWENVQAGSSAEGVRKITCAK
jgi:hypothetical protein